MMQYSWQGEYLESLATSDTEALARFESPKFLSSIVTQERNAVAELLLHRTIAQLDTIESSLRLLRIASDAGWTSYTPRILARLTDNDRIREDYPEFVDYIEGAMQEGVLFAPFSIRDWHVVTNDFMLKADKNSAWSRQAVDIESVVGEEYSGSFSVDDLSRLLVYFFESGIRVFQIAIAAFTSQDPDWANFLHRVLCAPYINVRVAPARGHGENVQHAPGTPWAPNWSLFMAGVRRHNWKIYELHTQVSLSGQGSKGLREQLTVLFSLSGLLRDGIMLAPIDPGSLFVQKSHPIWGFGDKEFSAGGSGYNAHDVRALALSFLEHLPNTSQVSQFRSRLGLYFLRANWKQRRSALAATTDYGFFSTVVEIAKHFTANNFDTVISRVGESAYSSEPLLQYLYSEAKAARTLVREIREVPSDDGIKEVAYPSRILCVAHASEPHQNGGYAVRAHGILRHLKEQGINISAVTRPGFPFGRETEFTTDIVDGVEYQRLPATGVSRITGEAQHMLSFVEPFEKLFAEQGVGVIHVRSTYLIALPALIAARRLGLKVLYEVSGLWDLVYHDTEEETQPLKRSAFPKFAESLVMSTANQVVVMNEALQLIASGRGADPSRITIAHNAVDTDAFRPQDKPSNDVFTLGYLGSFVSYEGIGRLVDVVKLLNEWGRPVQLLAVGDGIRRQPLIKRVQNEGLCPLIEMPGRVPHSEVVNYYQQMDVVVYPRVSTGTTEAITPLKPFEALALAKPIIVSDVAPLHELVGEDERGLVFKNGSVSDLAHKILRLMDSPDLGGQLGNAGRQWVVEHRNWSNVVQTFVEAYSRLI